MTLWDELEDLWRQRHDAMRLEEFSRTLLTASGRATGDTLTKYSLLWRRARLEHFQGMQAAAGGDDKAARRHFEQGAEAAREATPHGPHSVEAPFWHGVNLLEAARCKGSLAAMNALKPAEKLVQRAEAIDESYHFAGPLRVWGRIAHRKPLFMGGNVEHAIDIYHRALEIAPHNSTTLYYYAEALIDDKQRRAARNVLQQIVDAPDDPDWRWEQERDRHLAQQLLEAIKE